MHNQNDSLTEQATELEESNQEYLNELAQFVARMRGYYSLVIVIFVFICTIFAISYAIIRPTYSATAVIGPPNPSPATAMMSYMSSGAGVGGIAKQLLSGGASGGGNDPFQEFQQLLQSSRLAVELTEKDNILPLVFYRKWDAEHSSWRNPSLLQRWVAAVKRALNRPAAEHPNADTLKKYLENNLSISQAPNSAATIASLGSGYVTVSFEFPSRTEARKLLAIILDRADKIIRQEQMTDVNARISYISSELKNVTMSDQRQSMIQILTGQEEIKTMMVADKRYASTLISPPYVPLKPTFPPSPLIAIALAVLLSLSLVGILVWFERRSLVIQALLRRFQSHNQRKVGDTAQGRGLGADRQSSVEAKMH